MKVERIDHIHAITRDLDGAARLFGGILGKEFSPVWEGFGVRARFHPLGFEWMEPTDPNGMAVQLLDSMGEGVFCISFKVPDVDEAIAEMESRGIKLIEKFQVGKVTEAMFEPTNAFGVMIELCEYPGDDIEAAAAG